jgi:SRSO17 transposase
MTGNGSAGPEFRAEADAVAAWAGGLAGLVERIGPRFARTEARQRALAYLKGLLSPVARKNAWQLAEAAGDATPYGLQHLLGRADWDAEAVRDDLRAYVVEHLGDPAAVLVVDETGFLKKGTKSVGVARQYSGTAGRIENCQIGVFLAYASAKGRTFLDRELYLPKDWAEDRRRRQEAGVPEQVAFATKPQLAKRLLAGALDARVPAAWVTGDEVYGGDRLLRMWLEERRQPFVLAVKSTESLWADHAGGPRQLAAAAIAARIEGGGWQRLSAGEGAKGPRIDDWAWVPLRRLPEPGWGHWLVVRRALTEPRELAYHVAFGPAGASLAELVRVAGTRWAIEEGFETAKGEVGLAEYEVRKWDGWYRHVTLALVAHAYLATTRALAGEAPQGGGIVPGRPAAWPRSRRGGPHPADGAGGAPAPVVAGLGGGATGRAHPALVVVAAASPSPGPGLPLPAPPRTPSPPRSTSTTVVLADVAKPRSAGGERPWPGGHAVQTPQLFWQSG